MTIDNQIPENVKELVKLKFNAMKVLLVDDLELNIANNMTTLIRIGFSKSNIASASNGLLALQMVTKAAFDLIITDWNMPMADGFKFVKTLRAYSAYKYIPIIMITAQPDNNRAEVERYINGFLKKPYTVIDVENLIYSVVGRAILYGKK